MYVVVFHCVALFFILFLLLTKPHICQILFCCVAGGRCSSAFSLCQASVSSAYSKSFFQTSRPQDLFLDSKSGIKIKVKVK